MRPLPTAARARAKVPVATGGYSLQISEEIARGMRRCRAPVRAAIQARLDEIAASAAPGPRRAKALDGREPPLRFYVYEGYRIAYELDPGSRRVVVLDVEILPVD